VGAVNQPDHAELEQAILRYLGSQPPSEGREGTLYVRSPSSSGLPIRRTPVSSEADSFFSVPFVGADRTKLDQALARVRKGFKRDEILPGWHVGMVEEKAYSHRDDELGARPF